jgi:predicted ribosome quality control (RQC) complex YloA/Tae2 family protein
MVTDWMLVQRAAAELERELHGGRVLDAGLLDDGRFGIRIGGRRKRGDIVLAIDVFSSPPVPTLERAELSLGVDPGWARSIATTIRGLRVGAVRSRPGDRVLALDLGTTPRFGVVHGVQLVAELIPRFGNLLLVRDGTVLAAAKQFSPAENEARSVVVGGPYRPPPPRKTDAGPAAGIDPSGLGTAPIHVYRDGPRLVAASLVPQERFAAYAHTLEPALLPIFAEARVTSAGRRSSDAGERRRTALRARIDKRLRDTQAEIAQVAVRRDDAAGREALRAAGDALHTYGNAVPPGAAIFRTPDDPALDIALDPDLDAKANAARYFARYRKAADALPHLERRIALLERKRATLEELAFETDRADIATLAELREALDVVEGRKPAAARPGKSPSHTLLRIERPSGARIVVGRSPRENVDVTFRIARPGDLWFHARGIPGSHVVLQPPPGAEPGAADLDCAADLAALHSRARSAPRVEIDYTERKYVRKQRDAAPGMVWYTNARTRVGVPDRARD